MPACLVMGRGPVRVQGPVPESGLGLGQEPGPLPVPQTANPLYDVAWETALV